MTDQALESLAEAERACPRATASPCQSEGMCWHAADGPKKPTMLSRHCSASPKIAMYPLYAMALVSAGLNDETGVFEWLNKALAVRDAHILFISPSTRSGMCSARTPGLQHFSKTVVSSFPAAVGSERD